MCNIEPKKRSLIFVLKMTDVHRHRRNDGQKKKNRRDSQETIENGSKKCKKGVGGERRVKSLADVIDAEYVVCSFCKMQRA